MSKPLAFALALTLLLAGGLLHGLYAERWVESDELRQAVERVAAAPHKVGDWTGKDLEADPVEFERAGARGYWMRAYTNHRTGASVLVILMTGRAGKMAVHTPEVCYRGAGYDLLGAPAAYPVRTDLAEPLGTFWTARFGKKAGVATDLRLFWAWAGPETWTAADNPRWQFRGAPFLYKLYVSHDGAGPAGARLDADPGTDFLRQFLPELNGQLFSPSPKGVI